MRAFSMWSRWLFREQFLRLFMISLDAAEVEGCANKCVNNSVIILPNSSCSCYRSLEIAPFLCTEQGWHEPWHITEIEAKSAGYAETILKPHWTQGEVDRKCGVVVV